MLKKRTANLVVKEDTASRTLTKADITNAVHLEIGLSKSESSSLVTACIDHISHALIAGEDVKLANFGSFKLSVKKERVGRNPKTGEFAVIHARKVVTFKPSPSLSSRVDTELKRPKKTPQIPKQRPNKHHSPKEEVLELLSDRLGCDVENVGFLFEKRGQELDAGEIGIPDPRLVSDKPDKRR